MSNDFPPVVATHPVNAKVHARTMHKFFNIS